MASGGIVVSPGHYMLPIPINKDINIDHAVVETKLRDLAHFLKVRRGRPEEYAILNLQGLLALRLNRYEKALDYFYEVKDKDPENLNALANLQYVLEKLFRLAEAEQYKKQRNDLLADNVTDRTGELTDSQEKCLKLKLRCLAEQAYAYAFDIHSDTFGGARYEESNALYGKAISHAGSLIDIVEKEDWKFCMAFNSHKLFDSLYYENKLDAIGPHFVKAVELFHEITQRAGDTELQWDSWRHLGDIFRTVKMRKLPCSLQVPPMLQKFHDDPELCMLEAMKVSPKNARLLARYANFLYSLKKEIDKPLELLEQSINLDSSEFNFYAFTTRAMINIKMYEFCQKQGGVDQGLLRNILQSAKSDLEKAMGMHVTPWDLMRLGKVYYLLAKNHTAQESGVRPLMEKALLYLTNAADCQDGHKQSEVHLLRGHCLFDIGEKRSAVGCYNQAIECEPPTSTYTGNFTELLGVYLSMLREEKSSKYESFLAEIVYSLSTARLKYGEANVTEENCLGKYKKEYDKELHQLEEYCGQFPELSAIGSLLASVKPASRQYNIEKGGSLQQAWSSTVPHLPRIRPGGPGSLRPAAAAQATEAGANTVENAASAQVQSAVLEEALGNMQINEPLPRAQPIREAPKDSRNYDFDYDFYVAYPQSEKDWVSYRLLPELEPIRKLKGCTHDRDAIPGNMKQTSEIDLMKASASILLVINKDFERENECPMHQALRLRKESLCKKAIIPILRDNSQLPEEICIFDPFGATRAVKWNKLALDLHRTADLIFRNSKRTIVYIRSY